MKNSYVTPKYFLVMKVRRRKKYGKYCFGTDSPFVVQVELKMHWYGNLSAQNGDSICKPLAVADS